MGAAGGRNIKEPLGNALQATDGIIGELKDFYFDDQSWVIRYLIVDTGTWLSGRKVCSSPSSTSSWSSKHYVSSVNRPQPAECPLLTACSIKRSRQVPTTRRC
jgi:hypothetical protein